MSFAIKFPAGQGLKFTCAAAALLLLIITAGCRSDAYYHDRAVQKARAFLLENAPELEADQIYFVQYNRPVLLTGPILAGGTNAGDVRLEQTQICVTWRIPGLECDYMVYGVSSGRMDYWSPNRLIRKSFEVYSLPVEQAMAQARIYARNNLMKDLTVAQYNQIRFGFPHILVTDFALTADPRGDAPLDWVEAEENRLEHQLQLSLAWPLEDCDEAVVFCGTGRADLTGWRINFAGPMEIDYLIDHTLRVVKTPANAQTPILLPGQPQTREEWEHIDWEEIESVLEYHEMLLFLEKSEQAAVPLPGDVAAEEW